MNKTILTTSILTILCSSTYAAAGSQPAPAAQTPAATIAPATPTTAPAPEAGAAAAVTPSVALVPPPINCKYHIPADNTTVDQKVLSTWAAKAAIQSFEFNPASIDQELVDLKSCYTDPGWQGFNDALQKSGNIAAIKTQHLTVSSQVDGEVKINAVKDNQWKVSVPLQVVYQNDKEKLTQLLDIDLLVGRKISGDLGIMQMIAVPRKTANAPANPAQK